MNETQINARISELCDEADAKRDRAARLELLQDFTAARRLHDEALELEDKAAALMRVSATFDEVTA